MLFKNKSGGVKWIVVFLGNPGREYENTRHNVGFMVADIIEKQEKLRINKLRFKALTVLAELGGEKTLLVKPQTYMNLSGHSVQAAAAFYKLPPDRVLAVCDDVALPLGKIRVRAKGSSGGHNGLKSIISALGSEEFPRVKIGVGAPASRDSANDMPNWVLGKLTGRDAEAAAESCAAAARAVFTVIGEGVHPAMNMFN